MLFVPFVVMFFHCHDDPVRRPRYASMAPRYTSLLSVGEAATYQSYHACVTFMPAGREVILVHDVPERRQRCAVEAEAANAYATSGAAATRSTPSRVHEAGLDGSGTDAKLLPALAETNKPSANAASSSTVPPLGCTVMSQHLTLRFRLQLVPEFVET